MPLFPYMLLTQLHSAFLVFGRRDSLGVVRLWLYQGTLHGVIHAGRDPDTHHWSARGRRCVPYRKMDFLRWKNATSLSYAEAVDTAPFKNASKSALIVSASVVDAVRKTLVSFQRAVLQQLCRQRCRISIRHDLVVVAMHHQDRDVIFFRSSVKSVWEKATMPS